MVLRLGAPARPRQAPSVIASQPPPAVAARSSVPAFIASSQATPRPNRKSAPRHEREVRRRSERVLLASSERRSKVFPTPAPLSEEEKLLLHAKDVPQPVLLAWSGDDGDLIPLKIKDLDVPPLENEVPPDSGNEQK
jgi:hypothetical protein